MKHRQSNRNTQTSSLSSKEFSIQASGKMFHMVISGLYSDKPKSITREIYSNAFDAHAMVGKEDVPFDVIYPTSMDPTFTVRDYGPGIPHEGMEDFYTVLGHSTKEDTNVAVGKWGVGRMSPMSYTDTFNVVSRHKGMKAFYSVQLGEGGEPSLHTLAMPTPTDEPDGLEVSFPIDRWDISDFAGAARRMAMGLKVKPNVLNDENPFQDPEIILQGDGFYFFNHPDFSDWKHRGVYAQMGCVLYPISRDHIPHTLRGRCLVVEFPIGELDVTASREDLSYDEITINNIRKRLDLVLEKIGQLIEVQVRDAKTHFEACVLYTRAKGATGFSPKVKWNDKELDRFFQTLLFHTAWSRVSTFGKSVKCYWESENQTLTVDTSDITTVYIQNVDKKTREPRAAERIFIHNTQTQGRSGAVWIRYHKGDTNAEQEIELLKKEMQGYVSFVYTCDLPDPGPRGNRAKTKLKKVESPRTYWADYTMDDAEFQAGGIWMPISNNRPDDAHYRYVFYLKVMRNLGLVSSVVVVPKTYWPRFEKASNWKTLRSVVDEYVKNNLEAKQKFAASNSWTASEYRYLASLGVSNKWFGPIKKGVEESKKTYHGLYCGDMWKLLRMTGNLGKGVDVESYMDSFYKQYPLLKLYRSGMDEEFREYVRMVDAKQQTQLAA